jgi:hypothetical protein
MFLQTRCSARSLLAVATAAAAIAAVGCSRPKPPANPSTDFIAQAQQIQASAPETRPYWCNAAGNGTPLSGHGNGHVMNPIYADKHKGPLTWADCLTLSRQLDQTWTAVRAYDTKAKAVKAGFVPAANYTPGLGTHHTFLPGAYSGGLLGAFDPAKPAFLTYGGDADDAPLMGVSFTFVGKIPPPAYAGENDWWHQHTVACFETNPTSFPPKDLAEAEEITDEACRALGGTPTKLGPGAWLLHLWLPPHEYRPDIFASGHNCLMHDGVAPDSDPCWTIAHRDPALGLPDTGMPGDDHSGGGEHGH